MNIEKGLVEELVPKITPVMMVTLSMEEAAALKDFAEWFAVERTGAIFTGIYFSQAEVDVFEELAEKL